MGVGRTIALADGSCYIVGSSRATGPGCVSQRKEEERLFKKAIFPSSKERHGAASPMIIARNSLGSRERQQIAAAALESMLANMFRLQSQRITRPN
jgi:hypothetical protein